MNFKAFIELVKETFQDWSEDKASRLAAALAYYTVFSLAPLLIIVIGIAGLVLSNQDVQGQIIGQVEGLVGQQGAQLVEEMIQSQANRGSGILATIIGFVTLLLGATGVFGQLHDSLNTIWEVKPKPGRGILAMLKERFVSFTMILGIGFLLLVSLVLSTVLGALGTFLTQSIGIAFIAQLINFVISFAVVTLLFAMIYKILPDVEISWSDVWIGAAVTSLLFTIGRFALGLYLGRASTTSAYGAAGSLVLLLLWVYYSAQILFLGAEFTQVYARKYGSRIKPSENAVPVEEAERLKQGMGGGKQGRGSAEGRDGQGQPAPAPRLGGAGVVAAREQKRQLQGRKPKVRTRPTGLKRLVLGFAEEVTGPDRRR